MLKIAAFKSVANHMAQTVKVAPVSQNVDGRAISHSGRILAAAM